MITKRDVLEEMIRICETRSRIYSKGRRNEEAIEGYEKLFEREKEKANLCRMMIRHFESGGKLKDEDLI